MLVVPLAADIVVELRRYDADGHSGPHVLVYSNLFSLDAAHGITNQPAVWMEADTTELFAWNNTIFNASIPFQVIAILFSAR